MSISTNQEFQVKFNKYVGGQYELLSEYVNANTKIHIKCIKHNYEYDVAPKHFMSGHSRCPICRDAQRKAKFYSRIQDIYSDQFEFINEYIDQSHHVKIHCKKCNHDLDKDPKSLLHGHGCPYCSGYKISSKDYEEKIKEIHGDEFELLSQFVNYEIPIRVRHKKCGKEYEIKAQTLLNIKNCRECENELRKYSLDDVKQIFNDHGLTLLSDKYINNNEPMPYICKTHPELGIQYRKLSSILYLDQQGCPKCAAQKRGLNLRVDDNYYKELIENMGYQFISIRREITHKPIIQYICPRHKDVGIQEKDANSFVNNKGCPYCKESKGERLIRMYLNNHNIQYIQWKSFDDLRGIGGGKLSYDFYIPSMNVLIEFQGVQHYKEAPLFYKDRANEMFIKQKEHDKRKKDYALSHNFNLLEIPYNKIKSIDLILDNYFAEIKEAYGEK